MLYLSKAQKEQLIEHSKREAPYEACGILAGPAGKVKKIYPMTNAEKSRETFLMDPPEQFKVMKEMRNSGIEMVGIYHSHPETDAYPSAHDVELACYPDISYVIISLKHNGKPASLRSFRIRDKKISEEEVKIG